MCVVAGAVVDAPAPVWTAILSALHTIQHQQQVLSDAQAAIYAQQSHIALKQDTMLHRVEVLESRLNGVVSGHDEAGRAASPYAVESPWHCPLCRRVLTHRHSFKGHIRRLVNMSSRPKCHLNPRNPDHVQLAHRFEGADFYTQSRNFCKHFQAFVSRAISKNRDEDVSRELVSEWLAAARASDGRAFPTCSNGSGPDSDAAVVMASSDSSSW